jgi:hypothetical protein
MKYKQQLMQNNQKIQASKHIADNTAIEEIQYWYKIAKRLE